MKTIEVNEKIIGKRCKCIFTGLMVTGVIEEINITKYTAEVKVRFDEPHQWGDEQYQYDWAHARLHDEFGSLHHLEIIDGQYEAIPIPEECRSRRNEWIAEKSKDKYILFLGFQRLGEFDTISEAKKYAQDSGLTGAFNLIGNNYRDAWYTPE